MKSLIDLGMQRIALIVMCAVLLAGCSSSGRVGIAGLNGRFAIDGPIATATDVGFARSQTIEAGDTYAVTLALPKSTISDLRALYVDQLAMNGL